MKRRKKKTRALQHRLAFGRNWGGARDGAGRPKDKNSGPSHSTRPALASRFPVHVTAKVLQGVPMRERRVFAVIQEALRAGSQKQGFRLVHYTVLEDHMHLIVEAKDQENLSRGLQGLFVRVARAINRLFDRRGSLFTERYHAHILRTPSEVRNALRYVLHNARRHGWVLQNGRQPDPFSSARWFDGWKDHEPVEETLLARARTWLLRVGWRRHGRLSVVDVPGG